MYKRQDKGTSKDGSTRDAGETNSIYDTGFLVRLFCVVKVIRLVRFQGRQGGFMSSKAQTREKDYERGLRIADSRKAIGLSQDELAHRVDIGRQALSAIENGGDFKIQTLDIWQSFLECQLISLFMERMRKNQNCYLRQWMFFQIWMNCR